MCLRVFFSCLDMILQDYTTLGKLSPKSVYKFTPIYCHRMHKLF